MDAASNLGDKRRSDRRLIGQLMQVAELQSNTVIGSLVNLSESGFMLICKERLPDNAIGWFALELPEPVEGRRRVNVEARCVWCQKSSYSDDYGAGFEIRQM